MRRSLVATVGASAALAVALLGAPGAPGARATGAPLVPAAASVAPWSEVTGAVPVITQPDLLRTGDRLQVIWSQSDGSTGSVRVRALDSHARPLSPAATVVEGWLAVIEDPKLFVNGTDLVAAFAGIRSAAAGDPYVGPMVSARSTDGTSWTLAPGALTQSTAVGTSANIDAIDAGGEPFVAFSGYNPALHLHHGFRTGAATDTPDFEAAPGGSYYATLARDSVTGEVWAAWHNPNGDPSQVGTRVQRVWPQPSGPALLAPGSVTAAGQTAGPGLPVASAARRGGGVWVAYLPDYPTSSRIRLWQVGSATWRDVPAGGPAAAVALAAGPGGRLWLSWSTLGDRVLHAVRTNASVTRIGTARTFPQPGGPTSQLRVTTTEGSRGPLDVVASAQVGSVGEPSLYALQVLPALRVVVTPTRLRDGRVRVRVTDAGASVRRATVRFRGTTARTNRHGKVRFSVSPTVRSRRYTVQVVKQGYLAARVRVRVT